MRVPKYARHKPTGQTYVRLKGKCHYLDEWNSARSRERYRQLIAEYVTTGEAPIRKRDGESHEVRELILKFASHAQKYYGLGPGSQYLRIKPALEGLRHLLGTMDAAKFGPTELKLLRTHFASSGKRSRQYVNRLTKFVVHVFRWAGGEEIIPASVGQALATVPPIKVGRSQLKEAKKIKAVPDTVIAATLPHLSPVVQAMVELQRHTGARPGEICSIKPAMVDRSSDVWEVNLNKHKNAWRGKQRVIVVGEQGPSILEPFLRRFPDEYCFKPIESLRTRKERTTPLNQGNRAGYGGNRTPRTARKVRASYSTATYGRSIRRACETNGIEPWSPNQLRKAYATSVRPEHGIEATSTRKNESKRIKPRERKFSGLFRLRTRGISSPGT
jgi:integrase